MHIEKCKKSLQKNLFCNTGGWGGEGQIFADWSATNCFFFTPYLRTYRYTGYDGLDTERNIPTTEIIEEAAEGSAKQTSNTCPAHPKTCYHALINKTVSNTNLSYGHLKKNNS